MTQNTCKKLIALTTFILNFFILLIVVIPTVLFGVYPAPILDAIHYSVSTLIYVFDGNIVTCDSANGWASYFPQDNTSNYPTVLALLIWAILVPFAIEVLHYHKDNVKKGVKRILTVLWCCLTLQTIILLLYTLYIIVNLYFVFNHILSVDIPVYFSDQYAHAGVFSEQHAHAGVDSELIANNKPDNVLFSTNGPSGSSGNPGAVYDAARDTLIIRENPPSHTDQLADFLAKKEGRQIRRAKILFYKLENLTPEQQYYSTIAINVRYENPALFSKNAEVTKITPEFLAELRNMNSNYDLARTIIWYR
jgi:hypothetical protein